MDDTFDAFEYLRFLGSHWFVVAVAGALSTALALGVSLLLPKKYTATASVIIEPPGANDARLTTAVSSMYLESLKTYELFAGSDTLFAKAAEHFHLRPDNSQSIESLKHRILKVEKLRDTKILQISVTLPDPQRAQAVAEYVASETVVISHAENLASDHEFIDSEDQQARESKRRLDDLEKRWNELALNEPTDSLQSEIDADIGLRAKVEEQLVAAESEVAEYQQQSGDGTFAHDQLSSAQAQVTLLRSRSQELQGTIQEKTTLLASRTGHRDSLEAALDQARRSYDTIAARLLDAQASAGTHTERLRIIDPGIVPQRPSSPNVSLICALALFAALLASILYVSATFVYRRRQVRYDSFVHEIRA
jgi:uncharacterized protein involved in exopolysaccharide biosynthesis